ncbi:unnamed protein product [Thelazia callipaeda]|uniref:Cell cycle checkpoint protein RAD17 n=1 Tax=Thelazia callipaeda TaxID=103827 RepID=A0A158RAU6_THECL|nr:unnamed protein product [Thelazia callipaeda]
MTLLCTAKEVTVYGWRYWVKLSDLAVSSMLVFLGAENSPPEVFRMASVPCYCSSFESSSNPPRPTLTHTTIDNSMRSPMKKSRITRISHKYCQVEDIRETSPKVVPYRSGCSEITDTLIDRFTPSNFWELAVNPRKIDEVRRWIQKKLVRTRECKLLLLTGPTGSGKTITVKLLCRELKLELAEWSTANFYDLFYDPNGDEVICEESQTRKFAEFLKLSDYGSMQECNLQKVVVIEQLPNIFYEDPSILHSVLQNTVRNTVCMYIFIMSDVDSCWYLNPKRILPANIRVQLGFDEISFNASAVTFLSKALQRIALLMKVNISPLQIKKIAGNSNGDIRAAINNMHLCIDDNQKVIETIPLHSSTLVDSYHCLGKLLYAKRCNKASENCSKTEKYLNVERKKTHSRNYPLKDDINQVLEKCGLNGEKLAMFLHEHEPNFVPSLSSYQKILNNISVVDSAFSRWETRMDSTLMSYVGEVEKGKILLLVLQILQLAARSVVFYNAERTHKQGGKMYRFYKPQCYDTDFKVFSKKIDICAAFSSHYGELLSLTVPFIRLILPPSLNIEQYQVLVSMNSSVSKNISLSHSHVKNERVPENNEENEFEIEEIDIS